VPTMSYPSTEARTYGYPDQYKTGFSANKNETHLPPPTAAQASAGFPSPRGNFDAVHQYF
jgi:hypothetical protein